ncbi:MAG: transcription antitermination factor NusB [Patescibacteria group bacterium]
MANRHLSRTIVLQALFEWDFTNRPDSDLTTILGRLSDEFASGTADFGFMKKLVAGILAKKNDLNLIITKAAPEWPLDKISVVDRNVLRIGLYELLFSDRGEVPAKVAINEAIELGKNFGGENSGRFVNGVLGAVYKEIGEPGKDDKGKPKKKKIPDVPYEKMPIEKLGGAVVYARHEGDIYLALVHDIFGHWTLSKGRVEEGEDVEGGTIREIKEELGLDIKLEERLGDNEYIASDPEIGKKRKQVTYFLGQAKFVDVKLEKKGGLDDARWFKMADILDLNFYEDILKIITAAINILLAKK